MIEVLQRFTWNGTPKEIDDLFRVTKNRRKARAVIFSHQFNWEVRLLIGSEEELVSSQVCRTQEEVLSTGKQWKTAMIETGPLCLEVNMTRAVITLLAISFAATVVAQENNAAAEKEISSLMHEYFAANPEEFVKASERLLHEKYQFVDSNGQRVSRAESIARITNRSDSSRPPSTATLSEESISVTGNTAVATCKMSVQRGGGGANFRSLTVWVKESRGWKLLARTHTIKGVPEVVPGEILDRGHLERRHFFRVAHRTSKLPSAFGR